MNDASWRKAKWYDAFHVLDAPAQLATPKTSFALVHDGANIYIAIRAEEPEPKKLSMKMVQRDADVWADDCVEIFIDSQGKGERYYHLIINPSGTLYDAKVVESGLVHRREWNCGATVETHIGTTEWTVEVGVPFSDLSFDPEEPSLWRLNVARQRKVSIPAGLFTFAPLTGTLHRPENFAVAKLSDADLSPFLLDVVKGQVRLYPKQGEMLAEVKTEELSRAHS